MKDWPQDKTINNLDKKASTFSCPSCRASLSTVVKPTFNESAANSTRKLWITPLNLWITAKYLWINPPTCPQWAVDNQEQDPSGLLDKNLGKT